MCIIIDNNSGCLEYNDKLAADGIYYLCHSGKKIIKQFNVMRLSSPQNVRKFQKSYILSICVRTNYVPLDIGNS